MNQTSIPDTKIKQNQVRSNSSISNKDLIVISAWAHGQKIEHRLKFRATIIWKLHREQLSIQQVAADLHTSTNTVRKWRGRFADHGPDGLFDAPRSGAPSKFDVTQRCELIALACDKPEHYSLEGVTHWTLDQLTATAAQRIDGPLMSRSSVARTLSQNHLKPHKTKMWLHSPDPQFKEKVNDIVNLYTTPPEKNTIVISVDEKTGMQATEQKYELKLPSPMKAGRKEYEYIRHGTQALIAGFSIADGEVTAVCGDTRTADDLLAFMEKLADRYKDYKKIVIIWDNLNIHHDGPTKRWITFNERHGNKFEFHYTPIHASWVNQIEIFFSILQKRCLKHGNFSSKDDLKRKVLSFIQRWNGGEGHTFNWTFRGYPMQNQEQEAA